MKKYLSLLVLFCFAALPCMALVNAEAPTDDDERFDAVGAWGHTSRLNDGMGNPANHQWYGSAVLIAPDVVLTAKHLLPNGTNNLPEPGAMTVRFRRHEDGSIGSRDKDPDSYHQVTIERFVLCPNADMMLCILSEPIEHITPVAVDLSGDEFEAEALLLAAWGSQSRWQGNGGPRTELRIGMNAGTTRGAFLRIDSFQTERREKREGEMGNYIIDENTCVNMYDSGGSMFLLDDDGNARLVGIVATFTGGSWVGAHTENEQFPLSAAVGGGAALLAALGEED